MPLHCRIFNLVLKKFVNYIILIGCHGYFKGIDNCMQSYMATRKSTAQPYLFKLKIFRKLALVYKPIERMKSKYKVVLIQISSGLVKPDKCKVQGFGRKSILHFVW